MIAQDFYDERRQEIENYFEFLQYVVAHKARLLISRPGKSRRSEIDIPLDLSHTFKANGFLLLYNLVEATLSSAIEDIHESITADVTIGADQLVESLARQAISRINCKSLSLNSPLSACILQHWIQDHKASIELHKNPLFSGNVDARLIKEVAKIYGFSAEARGVKAKNGTNLVKVKTKRNELAHGKISFRDCGRDIAIEDLVQIKNEVLAYLEQILKNINAYIANKNYLKSA